MRSGLNSRRLQGVGRGIALEAGVGLGNRKLNKERGLNSKYIALIGQDLADIIFFYELKAIRQLVSTYRLLLISLGIHKVVQIAVIIQILHVLALNASFIVLIIRVEGTLGYSAGHNVLHLGTNKSCALARLYMLETEQSADHLAEVLDELMEETATEIPSPDI